MPFEMPEHRLALPRHPLRNVAMGALIILIVLSTLWITAARGYIELPGWVPSVLRAHPYGPPHPVYGAWTDTMAVVGIACIVVCLACYVIYRISRVVGPDEGA